MSVLAINISLLTINTSIFYYQRLRKRNFSLLLSITSDQILLNQRSVWIQRSITIPRSSPRLLEARGQQPRVPQADLGLHHLPGRPRPRLPPPPLRAVRQEILLASQPASQPAGQLLTRRFDLICTSQLLLRYNCAHVIGI